MKINMTKAYKTDTRRSVKNTLSRFISIIAIVALGTSFFVGFKATYPDMMDTAKRYFKTNNLMDLRVQSNIGIYDDEIEKIAQIDGVETVVGQKFVDGLVQTLNDEDDPQFEGLVDIDGSQLTVRAYSLDVDKAVAFQNGENDPTYINRLSLIDGEWPDDVGECVVTDSGLTTPDEFKIGEVIKIAGDGESMSDSLETTEFTIVGIVETPYYLSFERGATTAGSGKLGDYIYVPKETFKEDVNYYSEAYIKVKGSDKFDPYTDKYDEHIEPVADRIREATESIVADTVAELYITLPAKIMEGETTYSKAEAYASAKLGEAQAELETLRRYAKEGDAALREYQDEINSKYADALSKISKGNSKYSSQMKQYNAYYSQVMAYEALLSAKQQEYDTKMNEYNSAKDTLTEAKIEIAAAENQIRSTEQMLSATQMVSDQVLKNYSQSMEELDLEGLAKQVEDINPDLAKRLRAAAKLTGQGIAVDASKVIADAMADYNAQLAQAKRDLQDAQNEYSAGKARLDSANAQLAQAKRDLNTADSKLKSAKSQLETYKQKLQDANIDLKMGELEADSSYRQAMSQLELKKSQAEAAAKNLEEYEAKYAATEASVNEQLLAARTRLDKATNLLDSLDEAYLNVYTRDDSPGYSGYGSVSYNMKSLAKVFPTFFFIVSTLICLVTMTRMVEEERTQLGTLKALGYGNDTIVSKYILYALSASLIGSVIGISIGFVIFPKAIFAAWGIMYDLPSLRIHYIFGYIILAMAIAVLSTCGAALWACRNELMSVPAVLMRPKPPKEGKRVLLENVDAIWSRLSFTSKITVRNLFRNPKRFIMTLVGIGGCTALILAGFGLSDSVSAVIDKQYGKDGIAQYDLQVVLKKPVTSEDLIVEDINDMAVVEDTMPAELKVCKGSSDRTDNELEVDILVPEDASKLNSFVKLENKHGKKQTLTNEGAIITKKFADKTDSKVGDTVKISWTEGSRDVSYDVKVAAIVDNYTFHYVYMTPSYYEKVTGKAPQFTYLYTRLKDGVSRTEKIQLENEINEYEEVNGSVYTSVVQNSFENIIHSLNMVIIVLIIAAAALAFVVLYNLNNINVNERIRELATLKVLGFYDGEVSAYIYRENVILTILGILLGLILGIPVQRLIVSAIDIDTVTFGTQLDFSSFLFAALLTVIFAIIVNLIMHFNLKHIKMVESLKSVE